MDFIVLDMELERSDRRQILIILGHPFLVIANANINYQTGVMDVSFGNMKVWMNIYRASKHLPVEEADCCAIAMMDELVEKALSYILMKDPLEVCHTHFGSFWLR